MNSTIKRLIICIFILFCSNSLLSQRDLETITSEDDLKQYIFAAAPSEDAFVAVQRLAAPYIDKKDWNGAVKVFTKFSEYFPENRLKFDKIIELLNAPSENLMTKNISAVNTTGDEYFPVISIDGNKLYFTGNGRKDCIGGEDIFISGYVDNQWQPAKNTGPPFSTKNDEGINSISADGNMMILFGTYKGAIGGGDNFYTEKTPSGWSLIKPFPFPVNSKYWDCDGFLTADGKAFLFSSERPGGVGEFHQGGHFFHGLYEGNTDIYVCIKIDSGWGKPINLGITINTPFTERSPFLHPDGKTLYFSSDGHYGLGGLDVFKSVRLSDTSWTEWSEPVNLGKDINTSSMDIAYKITTDGVLAYFSSDRPGGKGGYDIYSITLPPEAKPSLNVMTIKGKVTDENDMPLEADLKWFDLKNNLNVGNLKSDPLKGDYLIVLPAGTDYSYFAEKQGYYSVSNEIDVQVDSLYKELIVDIKLMSVKYMAGRDSPIVLNNIFFDFNKFELKPESYVELDRVEKFLQDNANLKVEISAYTDSIGSDTYNLTLSQKRAESVVNYLVSKGIPESRLIARGYGRAKSVASNETEVGRAMNRRVEMKIIK
jgi:outer membrane protein OmpA-like peptidoglycan-associated protein